MFCGIKSLQTIEEDSMNLNTGACLFKSPVCALWLLSLCSLYWVHYSCTQTLGSHTHPLLYKAVLVAVSVLPKLRTIRKTVVSNNMTLWNEVINRKDLEEPKK
jgi:hypothetical protein